MTTLLIDNSNTRTKFALASEGKLLAWRGVIETKDLTEESVNGLLASVDFHRAAICSVVPEKEQLLKETLSCDVHCVSCESDLGMGISYPTPCEIGSDRLANAVAAFRKYGAPAVVIDSGTAVTFDVIESPGLYAGGVIAPGLNLLTEYFAEKTALLPEIELSEPQSFVGKSTVEAMNIGAIAGFRGLIREILTGLIDELPEKPKVIATGGDADLLFRGIQRIDEVDSDLTIEGIMQIADLNFV